MRLHFEDHYDKVLSSIYLSGFHWIHQEIKLNQKIYFEIRLQGAVVRKMLPDISNCGSLKKLLVGVDAPPLGNKIITHYWCCDDVSSWRVSMVNWWYGHLAWTKGNGDYLVKMWYVSLLINVCRFLISAIQFNKPRRNNLQLQQQQQQITNNYIIYISYRFLRFFYAAPLLTGYCRWFRCWFEYLLKTFIAVVPFLLSLSILVFCGCQFSKTLI